MLWWGMGAGVFAQKNDKLPHRTLNVLPTELAREFRFVQGDCLVILNVLQKQLRQWREEGYCLANLESFFCQKDTCIAQVYKGTRFQWIRVERGNLPEFLFQRTRSHFHRLSRKPLIWKHWQDLQKAILRESEQSGYPFATVELDSVMIVKEGIYAKIAYQAGNYYEFDSLDYPENVSVKKQYLANYLQILPQQPFDQRKIDRAERRLRSLPYLHVKAAPTAIFDDGRVITRLAIQPKKASQLEGVLGFLPNANNGRLLLVGQFHLDLHNLFSSGKRLRFYWQQFKTSSQTLNLRYQHPNLLKTTLDVAGELDLLKEENTFLTVQSRLELQYQDATLGKIKALLQTRNARKIEENPSLPAQTNFLSYGLAYEYQRLDNPLFPHKGWQFSCSALAGNKTLAFAANDTIFSQFPTTTFQGQLAMDMAKYWRVGQNTSLMYRGRGMKIWNDYLFINELERFGGLQTMRGFNERAFFVSAFWLNTLSYRLHFDQQDAEESMLFVFIDQAWTERKLWNETASRHQLRAIGAGLQLQTKAGIFQFIYALGKTDRQPFAFNQAKIHFGLMSRF